MANYSQTPANVLQSANADLDEGIAGEAILAGQPVFVDATDSNKIKLSGASAAKRVCVGLAVNSAPAAGQKVRFARKDATFNAGITVAAGAHVYLSATAGLLADAALGTGNYGVYIGTGIGSNQINLNPNAGGLVP